MNDVIINKIQSMQRCIARARDERKFAGGDLASNVTHQDAAVLNITRACELAIDLANHAIKVGKLGIPTDSRESFDLLQQAGLISVMQAMRMKSMVGFRKVAVHDYRNLDPEIVAWVMDEGLQDLLAFAETIRQASD